MSNQRRFCPNCGHEQPLNERLGVSLPASLVMFVKERATRLHVPESAVVAEAIRLHRSRAGAGEDDGSTQPVEVVP